MYCVCVIIDANKDYHHYVPSTFKTSYTYIRALVHSTPLPHPRRGQQRTWTMEHCIIPTHGELSHFILHGGWRFAKGLPSCEHHKELPKVLHNRGPGSCWGAWTLKTCIRLVIADLFSWALWALIYAPYCWYWLCCPHPFNVLSTDNPQFTEHTRHHSDHIYMAG